MFKDLKILSTLHEIVFQYFTHIFQKYFYEPPLTTQLGLPSHFYACKHLLRVLICVPSTSQGFPYRKASEPLPPLPPIIRLPAESMALIKWDAIFFSTLFLDHCSSLGLRNGTDLFFHSVVPDFSQNFLFSPESYSYKGTHNHSTICLCSWSVM